jgi:hypothetical protein
MKIVVIGGTGLIGSKTMKRILCSLLVATLPLGSVLAGRAEVEERKGDPRLPARAAERSRQEH